MACRAARISSTSSGSKELILRKPDKGIVEMPLMTMIVSSSTGA